MRPFSTMSMRYDGKDFLLLDQARLPQEEKWVICNDTETLIDCMQRLAIRGAPAIGIASAVLLAVLAKSSISRTQLIDDARLLRLARPTAVNLLHCIDRVMDVIGQYDYGAAMAKVAEEIKEEDITL